VPNRSHVGRFMGPSFWPVLKNVLLNVPERSEQSRNSRIRKHVATFTRWKSEFGSHGAHHYLRRVVLCQLPFDFRLLVLPERTSFFQHRLFVPLQGELVRMG